MARNVTVKETSSRLLQIAAAIVIIFSLRYSKEVLIPIALAVLFSFLLAPLVHRLERLKLGRVPSVLLVVVFAFGILGVIGFIVTGQLKDLSEKLPEYTETVEKGIERMSGKGGVFSRFSQSAERLSRDMATKAPSTQIAGSGIQKVEIVSTTPRAMEWLVSTFTPVLESLATAFVVIVLCIFMLIDREDLRDRIIRLVSHGELNVTTQAMDDAATRVSKYLGMQALMNGSYGVLVATGLFFLKVPSPLLWGLMATLLRFLPYVGPWLGAAIPVLLSFATLGSTRGFMTVGMYATLEIIVSSFIEPWLYGSRTGVSSIAILAAAAFWSWVWGGVGLLLSTPLTVLLVVVGKYVPQLEFLSVLLGDEPVFDPPTRYYQRLLASDQEEASELVEEFLKIMPLEQVYEEVLIPALSLAHRDRFRGRLDDERSDYIRAAMKDEITEFGERPPAEPKGVDEKESPSDAAGGANATVKTDATVTKASPIAGAENVQILCLPARDEADELAGMMFAQVLGRYGFKAEAVSVTALASEMIELVSSKKADVVVISALPPSAITHARYLCKRLHQKFPDIKMVIGLWTSNANLAEAKTRIICNDTDPVVNNFPSGIHEIGQLAHPLLLAKAETDSVEVKEKRMEQVHRTVTASHVGAEAEKRD
jgi:predicted PurR-regulated permease PerM